MNTRFLLHALASFSVVAGGSGAMAADLPGAVFDRYVAAVHAGDMAAVRALISPDVERSDFVGCRAEMDNPTCLAHYIEATVVKPKARVTERSRSVQGDTIDAVLEVRSPLYTQAGVERILGRDIVRVRDGRIAAFRFVPDFADEPTAVFFGTLGIGPRAARPATKP
jgi:ketosteroid isomerase-like protein